MTPPDASPRISVVLPAHNAAGTLPAAVRSVLGSYRARSGFQPSTRKGLISGTSRARRP